MKKFLCAFLSVLMCVCVFSSCSKKADSTPVKPENFRITAYVVADTCKDLKAFEGAHINEVTDIILFGVAEFDEQGNVNLSEDFDLCLKNLKTVIGDRDKNLYLNILGPKNQSDSDDWYDQMADQAQRYSNAFESGKLENNIKTVLEKNGFDGLFFDYEYPIKNKYWKTYNKFIVSLDNVLGDDYKIGMALADWDLKQSKQARDATDFIEIMSYDNWDDDGNHSTVELAKESVKKFVNAGYDKAKLDLGVPFYARPTTQEAYWYDYKSYYKDLDENGLYKDSETGLTFSFNTYDVIKEKTDYAIEEGLGGMMVWHWACDAEYGNDKSLFAAIQQSKSEAISK